MCQLSERTPQAQSAVVLSHSFTAQLCLRPDAGPSGQRAGGSWSEKRQQPRGPQRAGGLGQTVAGTPPAEHRRGPAVAPERGDHGDGSRRASRAVRVRPRRQAAALHLRLRADGPIASICAAAVAGQLARHRPRPTNCPLRRCVSFRTQSCSHCQAAGQAGFMNCPGLLSTVRALSIYTHQGRVRWVCLRQPSRNTHTRSMPSSGVACN